VLKSISRLQNQLQTPQEKAIAVRARRLISLYSNMEELVRIGVCQWPTPRCDEAVRLWPLIETFLSQDVHDVSKPEEAFTALANILYARCARRSGRCGQESR